MYCKRCNGEHINAVGEILEDVDEADAYRRNAGFSIAGIIWIESRIQAGRRTVGYLARVSWLRAGEP